MCGGIIWSLDCLLTFLATQYSGSIKKDILVEFIIIRNYLTPILLMSLYIESYGAMQLEASNKRVGDHPSLLCWSRGNNFGGW